MKVTFQKMAPFQKNRGEERMAFGAFARFDKNRNHYLQGIEIESWPFQGVEWG